MSSLSEVAAVIRRRNIEGTSDVEFREQLKVATPYPLNLG